MEIKIALQVTMDKGNTVYDMKLDIPTSFGPQSPFLFDVTQIETTETEGKKSSTVMRIASGGDEKHVYAAMQPPANLLAGAEDYIKELRVELQEGEFDNISKKFKVENTLLPQSE